MENDVKFAVAQQESRKIKEDIQESLDQIDLTQEEVNKIAHNRFIRGKTLQSWNKQFDIVVDYAANPTQVNKLLQQMAKNIDDAYRNLSQAKLERKLFKCQYSPEMRKKIASEAAKKGKKTPGLETMSTLAEDALGIKTVIKEYYDFEIDYWESTIQKMNSQIQLVRILSISNGTRYRIGEPVG